MCSELKALLFVPVPTRRVRLALTKNKQTNDRVSKEREHLMQIITVWSLGSVWALHSLQPFGLSLLVSLLVGSLVYLDHSGTLYWLVIKTIRVLCIGWLLRPFGYFVLAGLFVLFMLVGLFEPDRSFVTFGLLDTHLHYLTHLCLFDR